MYNYRLKNSEIIVYNRPINNNKFKKYKTINIVDKIYDILLNDTTIYYLTYLSNVSTLSTIQLKKTD